MLYSTCYYVILAVPPPTLDITSSRPAYNGTNFTLTCTITLNEAVDTSVNVVETWTKDDDSMTLESEDCIAISNANPTGDSNVYVTTLTFNPLGNEARHGGSYACNASIAPVSDSFVRGISDVTNDVLTVEGKLDMKCFVLHVTRNCACYSSLRVGQSAYPELSTWNK